MRFLVMGTNEQIYIFKAYSPLHYAGAIIAALKRGFRPRAIEYYDSLEDKYVKRIVWTDKVK